MTNQLQCEKKSLTARLKILLITSFGGLLLTTLATTAAQVTAPAHTTTVTVTPKKKSAAKKRAATRQRSKQAAPTSSITAPVAPARNKSKRAAKQQVNGTVSSQPARPRPLDDDTTTLFDLDNEQVVGTETPGAALPTVPVATSPGAALAATVAKEDFGSQQVIQQIILERRNPNKFLTDEAIYSLLPYSTGDYFDPPKTSTAITNLYNFGKPFSYFEQVKVMGEWLDARTMNLHIITYEKPELTAIILEGNHQVKYADLDKELKISEARALGDSDIKRVVAQMVALYRDKNFHNVQITAERRLDAAGVPTILVLQITENKPCYIKRVRFHGNHHIPAKVLRGVIFTREDWVLGALNKAGKYVPDNLDMDRHMLENYYQSNGYMKARVDGVAVVQDPKTGHFDVTFNIVEGDLYTIGQINVEENGLFSEAQLRDLILIKPGDLYSTKALRDTMEVLRTVYGRHGYIFADVSPAVVPDETRRTVDLTFASDLGNKVRLNRVNIIGNKKTSDAVIRRNLLVEEGEILTSTDMDLSKAAVGRLGYFDYRDGINWKINRIADDEVDLDLILKEVKTGKAGLELVVGGTPRRHALDKNPTGAPGSSAKAILTVRDTNLWGEGYLLDASLTASKQERGGNLAFTNPYTFDRPLMSRVEYFYRNREYFDELKGVQPFHETRQGVTGGFGFDWQSHYFGRTKFEYIGTFENFSYGKESGGENYRVRVDNLTEPWAPLLQSILDRQFHRGQMVTLENLISQDYRDRGLHPTSGHKWLFDIRTGYSTDQRTHFQFYKIEFDTVWYTPLIDSGRLVFALHSNAGIASNIGTGDVPYMELFHVGGPDSVRGYNFGQIGPTVGNNSIGSTKQFIVNAELLFPIMGDNILKGVFFYDGGAGWGVANAKQLEVINPGLTEVHHRRFDFRQSVGFGIRMTQPQPIRVDWGFKLDRRPGESASEVHFSTYREF